MNNNDFLDALEKAGEPKLHEGPYEDRRRAYDVLPQGPGANPIRQYRYTFHEDTFITFQPWDQCKFCMQDFRDNKLTAENATGFVCPHTRRTEYLALRENILQNGWMDVSSRREILKDGTVMVSLEWMVPKSAERRLAEKKSPERL
jgi:hypothetical protein